MTLTTITISATDYVSYATVAEANNRLRVDPVRTAAWSALSGTTKSIDLVAATNRLDLLNWAGEKAGGAAQINAWPRTGLVYPDGTPVSSSGVPVEVQDSTILTAGSIAIDPTFADAGTSGSNIEEVGAGKTRVKFFRPVKGAALQDESAYALIQFLLTTAGSSSLFGAATGNPVCSSFESSNPYGLNRGYP